ncbi:FMN-dependent NADH-azoreductase [Nitrospirillum pindoramense]|uniref:FMN dependent NADH:quinone oxidoreductase n=2 Tax=Nitrospirillum amazonense TaxID=28077 RepID=A0A560HDJ6_9PROT|nr:FMN-dependent NADH-azoreductase [Nitrospirillum amazonense]
MRILHIDSSFMNDTSGSRDLSAALVTALRDRHPGADVVRRDLVRHAIPHLDAPIAAGFREIGLATFDTATLAEHKRSADLVQELLTSDIIVIGAPMYNFSIPTQLKAWIDRVVQPARTFKYTATGPIGLGGGRRVIVVSTRGGFYENTPLAALDFQESYLKAVFGFMGIHDVEILRAEGMSRGPEARTRAMSAARAGIANIVAAA